ncbi:MAG: hypothetical protein LBJ00_16480 [Planctomycetaceae bacterium]|nr:hypothetical protein [Planctomycetaceae bacterium]
MTIGLIVQLFVVSELAVAQTSNESQPASDVLRYRRWLAPFDRISEWPLKGERYVPMRRDLFEERVNLFSASSNEAANIQQNEFTRIVMNAKLKGNQLVEGNGYFEIAPSKPQLSQTSSTNIISQDADYDRVINLESWGQWINIPQTPNIPNTANNGKIHQRNARVVCTSGGKTLLLLSEQNNLRNENTTETEADNDKPDPNFAQRIYFDWSLRGKTDPQGRLQFYVKFPRSAETELNIELPLDKVLTCSSGVVIDGGVDGQRGLRNWKISTGTVNGVTITISNKNNPQTKENITGYHQTILYNISTSGLEVTATLLFDQNDPEIGEFEIELESPLVLAAIHSGGVAIPSSFIERVERESHTLLRIDVSEIDASRQREITLVALAPIVTGTSRTEVAVGGNIWELPRIKAISKKLFWKETHCSVVVQRPLQTRNLSFTNSTQVRPMTDTSRLPHDTFEVKYFSDDAQVGVNIYQEESRISVESFVQIHLNDDSISGSMIAAIQATEGRRFTLLFPISPNWAINSVKGVAGDEILSWDIIPAKDLRVDSSQNYRNNNIDSYLSIQLKKTLGTGDVVWLQIVGRFLADPHREFRLAEFSPLSLSLQKNESHLIAIQTESLLRLQYRLQNSVLFEIHDSHDAKLQKLFFDQPEGTLLPLDMRTQEIAFKVGRARPDYTANIMNKMSVGTYNTTASFKFNIKPHDAAIERVYIYFIETKNTQDKPVENKPNNPQTPPQQWQWEITASQPRSDIYRTEIPKIIQTRIIKGRELDEFTAALADRNLLENFKKGELWEVRLSALQNDPFEISATLPIAATDEIIVPFAVLPVALSQSGEVDIESDGQFPYTISYDNLKSIPADMSNCRSNRYIHAAFKFDPIDKMKRSNETMLKLQRINTVDTPPEAWIWLVKLENQYGIDGVIKSCANFYIESRGKDSLAVTLPKGVTTDDVGVVRLGSKQTTWRSISQQDLTVAIPPNERYVTVSIEYSYKNYSQKTVTEITPNYPQTDIPILGKNCIAWFHPDYKIVDANDKFSTFAFFGSDISNVASIFRRQNPNQHKALLALQCFNDWVSRTPSEQQPLTWQALSESGKQFTELLLQKIKTHLRDDSYDMPEIQFYVDMLAFAGRGAMPQSVVPAKNYSAEASNCSDLTVFISIKTAMDGREEYSFYFTSFLTAGVLRHFNGKQIGERVWFVDDENLAKFIFTDSGETDGHIYESLPSSTVNEPQMLKITDWIHAVQKTKNVFWSDTSQSFRQGNISPDWHAHEIVESSGGSCFIVRGSLLKCYYLAAFLVVVVLARKRPFAYPIFLILVMVVSQVMCYFLPLAYAAVAGGAFVGAGVSFIFVIIQDNLLEKNKTAQTNKLQTNETISPNQQATPL